MNGDLRKKRKTMNDGEEPMTFMKLPNDLVSNCLARVSRLQYYSLSLVSKRFRSLLSSPELYQIRTFLGCTEICLYVCLKRQTYTSPVSWFMLCPKQPNCSKKVLVPITSPNSTYNSDIATVGSNIYTIGGSISREKSSSTVMVLDCHSNTWREAPSMRIPREVPSVCVLDGKIYVTGGCKILDASNCMEVFDTKTQTWEFKLCGNTEKICSRDCYQSIVYEGTVHVQCLKTNVIYKLHEGSWIIAEDLTLVKSRWRWSTSACVIGNVFYACTVRGIMIWYDPEVNKWKALKGLGRSSFGSPPYSQPKLADSGGKLAICWEEVVLVNGRRVHQRQIWCGKIAIVKREGGEIWGTLECSEMVFIPHEPCNIARLLAVTL